VRLYARWSGGSDGESKNTAQVASNFVETGSNTSAEYLITCTFQARSKIEKRLQQYPYPTINTGQTSVAGGSLVAFQVNSGPLLVLIRTSENRVLGLSRRVLCNFRSSDNFLYKRLDQYPLCHLGETDSLGAGWTHLDIIF
jgi:hypothetical protein